MKRRDYYVNQEERMSYSICLKCRELVKGDIKYCSDCKKKYGLPNMLGRQLANFETHEIFDAWAKREVEKNMGNIKKD